MGANKSAQFSGSCIEYEFWENCKTFWMNAFQNKNKIVLDNMNQWE